MCTVTIIPMGDHGYRLVTNRDERRERPPALPPRRFRIPASDIAALWPVDPVGSGTWIGVNELGLAAAALNLNEVPDTTPRPTPARSRGTIIPTLLAQASARPAADALRRIDLGGVLPFRMAIVDPAEMFVARWDGAALDIAPAPLHPTCLASSGLGDALVTPRLGLFEREVVRAGARPATQDAFHDHQWPDRPEISVRMERAAARTVSRTSVTVDDDRISLRYEPIGGTPAALELARTPSRSAARE
mgnify:CR=1 FL=1